MRQADKTFGSMTLKVKYPDEVIFAFNPNYYELTFMRGINVDNTVKSVRMSIWKYNDYNDLEINSIDVAVYQGRAKVYISRMVQLAFYDPLTTRSVSVAIRIEVPGYTDTFDVMHVAIWGRIGIGQRLNAYGMFAYEKGVPYCYRVRKWFKNFPFKLSVFATSATEGRALYGRYDDGAYGASAMTTFEQDGMYDVVPATLFPNARRHATVKLPGVKQSKGSSVFDETFDYTFFSPSAYAVITKMLISEETDGHYLRWIDNFGQLQYYLFVKGEATIKNKLGSESIVDSDPRGGMWFPDLARTTSVETTVTHKCCAVLMPDEIWDYVETIIRSPFIDLYMGKTMDGEEIWCPVNIVASSHTYNPKETLHDLEISFSMPTENSQML